MEVSPRFRPDLEPFEHDEGDGEPIVVLKDPISDRYFRVTPHEHLFLRTFDGTRTIAQVRASLERNGHFMSEDEARVVLGRADAMGLLMGTASQRAKPLIERLDRMAAAKAKHRISEVFFIFLPLLNPDRFLSRTLWLFRLFVNRFTKWAMFVLAPGALYLAAAGWPRIQRDFHYFFTWSGVLALGLASVGVKLIHEFSHGWVAKGFGLRVPRMGIALLLWVPYLYCDTTDAWQLGSRRQRIWVSAAGIVAEVVLAILATYVWYFSRDGLVNSAAFNVMAVSLFSTVVMNANPLMKRDGYYVLSDFLRLPNLSTKAAGHLRFLFLNGVMGIRVVETTADSPLDALLYTVYGVLAFIYKVFIYSGIVSVVYYKFDKTLGIAMALVALVLFVIAPCIDGVVGLMERRKEIRPRPLGALAFVGLLALAGLAVFRPLHSRSVYPCYAVARQLQQVAVPLNTPVGDVHVQRGSVVKSGQRLFDLRTDELELVLRKKELERDVLRMQHEQELLDSKERARAEIRLVEVARAEDEIMHLRYKLALARRGVVAPFDAVVTRFDARMQPGFRPGEGAVVGELETAGELIVHAFIPDRDRHEVQLDQPVSVWLAGAGNVAMEGRIVEIRSYNEKDLQNSPFSSAIGGELVTEARDAEHRDKPLEPQYRCTVRLAPGSAPIQSGMTGRVAVPRPPRSLFRMTVDNMFHTFNRESLI